MRPEFGKATLAQGSMLRGLWRPTATSPDKKLWRNFKRYGNDGEGDGQGHHFRQNCIHYEIDNDHPHQHRPHLMTAVILP